MDLPGAQGHQGAPIPKPPPVVASGLDEDKHGDEPAKDKNQLKVSDEAAIAFTEGHDGTLASSKQADRDVRPLAASTDPPPPGDQDHHEDPEPIVESDVGGGQLMGLEASGLGLTYKPPHPQSSTQKRRTMNPSGAWGGGVSGGSLLLPDHNDKEAIFPSIVKVLEVSVGPEVLDWDLRFKTM
ncbi:hypothetical protein CSAL01_00989 [Colletotrichum salicis]|uniref:Uncharacterized protein n=1 Tax=Colletotrichum salicis TaxID=1209931 RepID=A0A135UNL2_9PEZI|nr:hypothetical protein CSAL01_00989 [Colletotrichum salicis]